MEFKKLQVYYKARKVYLKILEEVVMTSTLSHITRDQLRRAALSIVLNIAEGSTRITPNAKINFYVMARGSTAECYAIIDLISLSPERVEGYAYNELLAMLDEISKMLYGLIKSVEEEKLNEVLKFSQ